MQNIPITRPFFDEAERELLMETLESGWVVQGPRVEEFERLFGAFTASGHCVATTSCTTALHIALLVLGIGDGDEVIVPAFTWVATANVVEYVGGKPVFCDIDLETFNLDYTKVEALISEKTRAVLPVHLFGLCAEMGPILDIARRYDLRVVEDAACALGAWYGERHAGTLGDIGCFSFHPRKSITTGEGGMLVTANEKWARAARVLREHGGDVSDRTRHDSETSFLLPDFDVLGFNYRMTDLQGAMGCGQMRKVVEILEIRSRLAARYDRMLAALDWLRTPRVPEGCRHGYQAYVCLFAPEEPNEANTERLHHRRNRLMARMAEEGIATRPGTHAVHLQNYYARKYDIGRSDYPSAYAADNLSLALPLYPQMTEEDQDRVVASLCKAYELCVE